MYQNYMKPTFMTNTTNPSFGASSSSFGQPSTNTSLFPSMQPTNIFQTPSTSSFNAVPTTQNTFEFRPEQPLAGHTNSLSGFGSGDSADLYLSPLLRGRQASQITQTDNIFGISNETQYRYESQQPIPQYSSPIGDEAPNPAQAFGSYIRNDGVGRDTCVTPPLSQTFVETPPSSVERPKRLKTANEQMACEGYSTFGPQEVYQQNTPQVSSKQVLRPSLLDAATNNASSLSSSSASFYSCSSGSGGNLFGQQPQPSTSGLFGGNNTFGQNKAAFGFGSTPSQTGIFGQQPQQQSNTSLFQSSPNNLFGGNAFGNQTVTVGTVIKFSPATGTDTMQKNGVTQSISTKHHCITCMKEYENKSFEELRFEDYSCNRKGPQQQAGFGATAFGSPPSSTTSTIFGQTDNKQAFGQPQTFGQTQAFGQTTTGFGVTNQSNTPNLFGKPTTFGAPTSSATTFGFNQTPAASNPFSANQAQKSFSTPLFGTTTTPQQSTPFGTTIFGPNNTQASSANLFQKPAQPANGFTGQPGFSFSQPGTTQASNLFQVSKPNTGFGLFGQNNTATTAFGQPNQTSFAPNFAKLTSTPFSQPTQPTFANLTGGMQQQQQQPLFGNPQNKTPSLFGNPTTGGGLFANNVFQQNQQPFSLNMNQQHTVPFPPEPVDETKNISLIATDIYPDGPHVYGLEPVLSDNSGNSTNPQDIKAMLDYSKKLDEPLGTRAKIKVQLPKPKRGSNYNDEFFDANQTTRSSHRCLVIRKFNDNSSSIYSKYKNELLDEAEKSLKADESDASLSLTSPRRFGWEADVNAEKSETTSVHSNFSKGRPLQLEFDYTADESEEERKKRSSYLYEDSYTSTPTLPLSKSGLLDSKHSSTSNVLEPKTNVLGGSIIDEETQTNGETFDTPPSTISESSNEPETRDNPAKVILTKPEYYLYPPLQDLNQYLDELGECVVPGLTIGRRGYGNVHFAEPINITNMNFDEIVHFRHREVIVYPDESKKPPVGEGLNRPAQVTLDKIFPREKGTGNYITDVEHIIKSNFVDNLMHVTQKHNSKFVDYRPKTGSWVFKVKHFSKYAFTDSDEEDCEITLEQILMANKSQDLLKQTEVVEKSNGLGGQMQLMKVDTSKGYNSGLVLDSTALDYWPEEEYTVNEDIYHTESDIQVLKSSLFLDMDAMGDAKQMEIDAQLVEKPRKQALVTQPKQIESEVLATPVSFKLPAMTLSSEELALGRRCCTEMAVYRNGSFKVGWGYGTNFYSTEVIVDADIVHSISHSNLSVGKHRAYNMMMPELSTLLKITLENSKFTFQNHTPTLTIESGFEYLLQQTEEFNEHVRVKQLKGRELYLSGVWNLCCALWGPGSNTHRARKKYLSSWLERFAHGMSNDWSALQDVSMDESEIFKTIFQLLSFHKVAEASEFADEKNFNQLSLLINQLSANERFKAWLNKVVHGFDWKERGVLLYEFKKLYLLMSGKAVHESVNICEDLDWLRCFGLHLWYLSPLASPISTSFYLYKKAFEEHEFATKPVPPYCDSESQTSERDLIYHILALYVDGTHQLTQLLHPETHTNNVMDYRLSWFLLQVFQSLDVGLVNQAEQEYLHTTFSNQLENMGDWKSAIFVLLFLKNDILKKTLITKILDRNLFSVADAEVEKELVRTYNIPPSWIHEVKATKAKLAGHYYSHFQHLFNMGDSQEANKVLVDEIIPELFNNDQSGYLRPLIDKLAPFAGDFVNWNLEAGLVGDFLDLETSISENVTDLMSVANQFNSILKRINSFPVKNESQKLCVAELCRKCASVITFMLKAAETRNYRDKFVDLFKDLVLPPDLKSFDVLYAFTKYPDETEMVN